jgi:hypothetical protein
MSQNDLVIANQSFPATRADINSALQALGSSNSGSTEPATIYANMFWYDTTAKVLKLRSEANDAWISIGYFDQSANAFRILDDTQVTNTSGTQTGLLGDQATATWETGTSTTESLVSPAKVKAAVIANTPTPPTTDVPAEIAALSFGAVGTHAMMRLQSGASLSAGDTVAGSNLRATSASGSSGGTIGTGTWRCMGQVSIGTDTSATSLFLRIS